MARICGEHFPELLFRLIEFFLAFENRAEQEAGGFLAGRVRRDLFRRMGGLFRIRPALALFVDLCDIDLNFKIGGRSVKQGAERRNGWIGLRVFTQHQRLSDSYGTVLGVGVGRLARGVQRFRHIARLAVGVDDQDARPAVFLRAQAQHFLERVHGRRGIARFAV